MSETHTLNVQMRMDRGLSVEWYVNLVMRMLIGTTRNERILDLYLKRTNESDVIGAEIVPAPFHAQLHEKPEFLRKPPPSGFFRPVHRILIRTDQNVLAVAVSRNDAIRPESTVLSGVVVAVGRLMMAFGWDDLRFPEGGDAASRVYACPLGAIAPSAPIGILPLRDQSLGRVIDRRGNLEGQQSLQKIFASRKL